MPPSPGGNNTIEEVDGDPGTIVSRGEQIKDLGELMVDTSDTLSDIKNNAMAGGEMNGLAVAALQDTIGDAYEKLAEAGELYKPVGPVLIDYGTELERIQGPLNETVEACETKWTYFYNLSPVGSSYGPRGIGGFRQPDEGSPEADAQEAEDEAKKAAYDAWELKADAFDGWYDAWDTAFEDAVNGMTDAVSGSIKDSFWSKVANILSWAALVIGIAALIIGGPFLAGLAVLVGVLYLVAVIGQYASGEASLGDIGMAALSLTPFGKLKKLTTFTKVGAFQKFANKGKMKDAILGKGPLDKLKGLKTMPKLNNKDGLIGIYKNRGPGQMFNKLVTGNERGLQGHQRTFRSFYEGAGQQLADARNSSALRNLATIDYGLSVIDNLSGHASTIDKLTG